MAAAFGKTTLQAPGLVLVGAVDPQFAGQKLADLVGQQGPSVDIVADLAAVGSSARGGVVLHATGSYLHQVETHSKRGRGRG